MAIGILIAARRSPDARWRGLDRERTRPPAPPPDPPAAGGLRDENPRQCVIAAEPYEQDEKTEELLAAVARVMRRD